MESMLNGTGKDIRITSRKPIRKSKAVGHSAADESQQCKVVALAGVGLCGLMSAALNGYQHSLHAPAPLAGWALGVAVPVLVLVLGKVAGGLFLARRKWEAALAASAGLALLVLSIYHCSESIALLTGSAQYLSVPLAVAIDVGLVACEIAVIRFTVRSK